MSCYVMEICLLVSKKFALQNDSLRSPSLDTNKRLLDDLLLNSNYLLSLQICVLDSSWTCVCVILKILDGEGYGGIFPNKTSPGLCAKCTNLASLLFELWSELFYWLWPKIVQHQLDHFTEYWNNHNIRSQAEKPNISGHTPGYAFTVSEIMMGHRITTSGLTRKFILVALPWESGWDIFSLGFHRWHQ